MIHHRPTCHHKNGHNKITDLEGNVIGQCRCICTCPRDSFISKEETDEAIERYNKAKEDGTLDEKYPVLFKHPLTGLVSNHTFQEQIEMSFEERKAFLEQPPKYTCRFHPTEGWHEIGCEHQEWTVKELKRALDKAKRSLELQLHLNS